MSHHYVVLGAGRQGLAAAFDMAVHGDADRVVLADLDGDAARDAAARLDRLVGRPVAEAVTVDVTDDASLGEVLRHADVVLSAVPYPLNPRITAAAIEAGCHMCDLGGNTELVLRQLELDDRARRAGVGIVPDCGMVPGMGTSLMAWALGRLDEPEGVILWDGGIPERPEEPWNYVLTFHIAGLTNEYDGPAIFLEEGRRVEVECFDPSRTELVEFPEVGTLEAFVTAGGTSTMPWTYEGELRTCENRTLRYPGHAAQWKAFRDAGLLGLHPVEVPAPGSPDSAGRPLDARRGDGADPDDPGDATVQVVPRDVLHTLLDPQLRAGPDVPDVAILRAVATGRHRGRPAEARIDVIDRYDESTGFTAMQRTTGWDAAIVAGMLARGRIAPGAVPRERSVDPDAFVRQLEQRGFDVRTELRPLG